MKVSCVSRAPEPALKGGGYPDPADSLGVPQVGVGPSLAQGPGCGRQDMLACAREGTQGSPPTCRLGTTMIPEGRKASKKGRCMQAWTPPRHPWVVWG